MVCLVLLGIGAHLLGRNRRLPLHLDGLDVALALPCHPPPLIHAGKPLFAVGLLCVALDVDRRPLCEKGRALGLVRRADGRVGERSPDSRQAFGGARPVQTRRRDHPALPGGIRKAPEDDAAGLFVGHRHGPLAGLERRDLVGRLHRRRGDRHLADGLDGSAPRSIHLVEDHPAGLHAPPSPHGPTRIRIPDLQRARRRAHALVQEHHCRPSSTLPIPRCVRTSPTSPPSVPAGRTGGARSMPVAGHSP